LIGVFGTLAGKRSDRALAVSERSREERKDIYAKFLLYAEDSLHRFERVHEKKTREETGSLEADLKEAYFSYDENVSPQFHVMELVADQDVVDAAKKLKDAVNDVRWAMKNPESAVFKTIQKDRYNPARKKFIALAQADLRPPPSWWKRVTARNLHRSGGGRPRKKQTRIGST
jgi:hypothetical protein